MDWGEGLISDFPPFRERQHIMSKEFPHTPMHVSVSPDWETPYPLAVGHTMPDGSMSALTLFLTPRQALELQEMLDHVLQKLSEAPKTAERMTLAREARGVEQ